MNFFYYLVRKNKYPAIIVRCPTAHFTWLGHAKCHNGHHCLLQDRLEHEVCLFNVTPSHQTQKIKTHTTHKTSSYMSPRLESTGVVTSKRKSVCYSSYRLDQP